MLSSYCILKDKNGRVEEIHVVMEKLSDTGRKPRAFIHWVTQPLLCEVRLYEKLYVSSLVALLAIFVVWVVMQELMDIHRFTAEDPDEHFTDSHTSLINPVRHNTSHHHNIAQKGPRVHVVLFCFPSYL